MADETDGENRRRLDLGQSAFRDAMDAAVAAGVRDALLRHKLRGESVVVWRDGQVVTVPADEIVVPPAPSAASSTDSSTSAA